MKHKRFKSIFLAALFLLSASPLIAIINDNGDWQLWNYNRFYDDLNDKFGIMFEEEFRIGDDISKLFYQHTAVGFYYYIYDWMYILPAYRQIFVRDATVNVWHPIYMPYLDIKFLKDGEKWKFRNRSRFEYRIIDIPGAKDRFVYRNMTKYVLPFEFTRFKIQPYIAEEFFITTFNGFDQNRVSAGLEIPFLKEFFMDIYYRLRSVKPINKWKHQNIIGVNFVIDF
ncbi:hypothetical protein COB11_06915 [Candidatus Aerophobetes bacterium]|uniref:DUF2490 domain-containing protein n=1 Tax=Aerophobetes bacterium TaxID=2030807 RepID=A0A2A4YE85_UNCAE|nr:MAG: hypothetical protein COB11_06915 [Candidatus Aerophobetes bacterium]